jgi:hypothetical protein
MRIRVPPRVAAGADVAAPGVVSPAADEAKVFVGNHALRRAVERGTDRAEIENVLATGSPVPAHSGRLMTAKVYPFDQFHMGTWYPPYKRVEVCYAREGDAMFVVTVYVFYGTWKTV